MKFIKLLFFLLIILLILKIRKKLLSEKFDSDENKYIFKNQYLITNENDNGNSDLIQNIKKVNFDNLNFFLCDNLDYYNYNKNENKIFIIGMIIDPFNYKHSIQDIGIDLISKNSLNMFFKKLQSLSGRFVIYLNFKGQRIILNDCCGFKRLFYHNKKNILSSSEKIILTFTNENVNIRNDKKDYINSIIFRKSEYKLYDNSGFDKNVNFLLPNTFLYIKTKILKRIPFFIPNGNNYNQICTNISNIIRNSIKCLIYRNHNLIQPITAGSDSRVLLSCAKDNMNKIKFYIFNNKTLKASYNIDVIVAEKISNRLNINLDNIEINDDSLDTNFKNIFSKLHIIPLILPKTKNIEYHFNNNMGKININGNCAEVIKDTYNNQNKKLTYIQFVKKVGENNSIDYIQKSIKKYYYDNIDFCTANNIDICNLFHWEIKQGQWGSLYPFEQDIAIEEFSPFNNRELLLLGLKADPYVRTSKSNYKLFKDIILIRCPELMFIKFHPKLNEILN